MIKWSWNAALAQGICSQFRIIFLQQCAKVVINWWLNCMKHPIPPTLLPIGTGRLPLSCRRASVRRAAGWPHTSTINHFTTIPIQIPRELDLMHFWSQIKGRGHTNHGCYECAASEGSSSTQRDFISRCWDSKAHQAASVALSFSLDSAISLFLSTLHIHYI